MILSYRDINTIANKIIKKYEEKKGRSVDRVDIIDLLHTLYGVDVEYYKLSRNNSILGMASPTDTLVDVWRDDSPVTVEIGSDLVLVDSSLLEPKLIGRRNFTAAHEGAHQILFRMEPNPASPRLRLTTNVSRMRTEEDWEEWQANTLASCLLMPELQVKRMFWMLFSETYINIIQPGNKNHYLPFVAMAAFFGVSKEALAIRLRQLKLIGVYKQENALDIYQEVSQ